MYLCISIYVCMFMHVCMYVCLSLSHTHKQTDTISGMSFQTEIIFDTMLYDGVLLLLFK